MGWGIGSWIGRTGDIVMGMGMGGDPGVGWCRVGVGAVIGTGIGGVDTGMMGMGVGGVGGSMKWVLGR